MISDALSVLEPPVLIRERAFDEIRDAIISGRIAPGARLIERELCDALKISRASVREVLRRLTNQGGLDKWTDLGLFDTDILSAKLKEKPSDDQILTKQFLPVKP